MLALLLTLLLLLPVVAMLDRISGGRLVDRLALLSGDRGEAGEGDDDADDGADADKGDDADADDKDDDDKPLGAAGEKALAAEKDKRRQAQADLREFKRLNLTPAQIAELVAKGKSPDEAPDLEQIRKDARTEAQGEALRERVVDKIEAKAARSFADPEDAVAILLRQSQPDDFLDDGKVDVEAITEALADLLKKKPHLAAVQDGKRFGGSGDGGARKEQPKKAGSLEQAIAARLSPAS